MSTGQLGERQVAVRFTGTRRQLFGILIRGYVLMIPTIGVYRFWLTTAKRRFFWSNTEIDGDPLDYTGSALQLLIGFMLAVAIFLPLYGLFFYLQTQNQTVAVLGILAVFVGLWFLSGYALYRGRDFRLSRTLWRGIRFDQDGNAWGYALWRFLWSVLMVLTLGLVYPGMAAGLWRYRYNHTWFGNRQFSMTGNWRKLAGPYYLAYFLTLISALITLGYVIGAQGYTNTDGWFMPDATSVLLGAVTLLIFWVTSSIFRARETTRMLSTLRIGACEVTVNVTARSFMLQSAVFGIVTSLALGLLIVIGVVILYAVGGEAPGSDGSLPNFATIFSGGLISATLLVIGYLLVFGTFTLLWEIILGFGFWRLIARGTVLTNPDSLKTVQARAEDHSLAGEGLADALNVGAY
ncbi:MAG: hypothetical protein JWR75_2046 [Devosia sp.]|nr:hypothetical protein [Devosia sp.]